MLYILCQWWRKVCVKELKNRELDRQTYKVYKVFFWGRWPNDDDPMAGLENVCDHILCYHSSSLHFIGSSKKWFVCSFALFICFAESPLVLFECLIYYQYYYRCILFSYHFSFPYFYVPKQMWFLTARLRVSFLFFLLIILYTSVVKYFLFSLLLQP